MTYACTYVKTKTDVAQSLIDKFFSKFSIGKILSKKNVGVRG